MPYKPESISKTTKILFPIIVTVIVGLIAPTSVALVGFLMFGNLVRECGIFAVLILIFVVIKVLIKVFPEK